MSEEEHGAPEEGRVAWTRLTSGRWTKRTFRGKHRVGEDEEGELREDKAPIPMFLVQVESDTPIGKELLRDPIGVLRREIPEMEIPDTDVRGMTLRVNAEVPANPRHRSEVWMIIPGSTTAVGIQVKHPPDE